MNLHKKIAVVTGASSGLGEATARLLVQKNVTVYGLARNKQKLNNLEKEWGKNFKAVSIDLTNEMALKNWVRTTFSSDYFPQILINNAGVGQFKEVDLLSSDQWKSMMDTNLNAVHFLTSALVPFMKNDENSSHIINMGSVLGKVSGSLKSAYSATKFALQGYSEALFKELRSYNIKVSVVNSGSINTPFFESSGITPNAQMLLPEELAQILLYLLETPDNVLIDELTVRPLRPK